MVTRLVALIKQRLDVAPAIRPGEKGQFEVMVDGKSIAKREGNWLTRRFGSGYPDLDDVIERLEKQRGRPGD